MRRIEIVFASWAAICAMFLCMADYALADDQSKYDMRFGVNGGMYPDINAGEVLIHAVTEELNERLGTMVWLRHPGQGTAWFEVQPVKDTWDFRKLDAVINDNEHPWLMEIYGQVGTAYPFEGDFSKKHLESLGGKKEIMDYIKAHEVDMNDPEQRADAEVYVKKFVNRYKDKIKYWEIGNEGLQSPGRFDVVKNTYMWIKEVYPDSVVVITAAAGDDDNMYDEGLRAFDSLMKGGIADYFDIGNIHYYGRIEGDFEERLERRFDQYKGIMDKYGVRKPIWVTETSTSSDENSVLSGNSSERIQARHVVKRMVVFSAKGAEKVFWHDYRDTYVDNKFYQCNLVNPDTDIPKPAYYTFRLMIDKLGYYKTVNTLRRDDARLYEFVTSKGNTVFVSWSRSPQSIDLSDHCKSETVLITRIVEDDSTTEPETEVAETASVSVSESPVFIEPIPARSWDINRDGRVDLLDIVTVARHFGEKVTAGTPLETGPDVNLDGEVNISDLLLVAEHFGEAYSSPDS